MNNKYRKQITQIMITIVKCRILQSYKTFAKQPDERKSEKNISMNML